MKRSEELGVRSEWEPDPARQDASTDRAWLEIDLDCVSENVRAVRGLLAPSTQLMAVVKADAYGHGATQVASVALACGASCVGVATTPEGCDLRRAGISSPILVMSYVQGDASVRALVRERLTPVVCSTDHVNDLTRTLSRLVEAGDVPEGSLPLPVHAKVDTGLSRLGCPQDEIQAFLEVLAKAKGLLTVVGLCSHFACSDALDASASEAQRDRFDSVRHLALRAGWPHLTNHLANSAGTLRSRAFHYDMVRVGLALHGVFPAAHLKSSLTLRPSLELKARVTQLRTVASGTGVSYGWRFVANRPARVAVVSVGYADGVPCALSHKLEALIRGRRARQIGRIAMDQMMVDVSELPGVASGDVVTIIGRDGSETVGIEDWARALGTVPWEVPCRFTSRIARWFCRTATSRAETPRSQAHRLRQYREFV